MEIDWESASLSIHACRSHTDSNGGLVFQRGRCKRVEVEKVRVYVIFSGGEDNLLVRVYVNFSGGEFQLVLHLGILS